MDSEPSNALHRSTVRHRVTVGGVVTFDFSPEALDRVGVWFLPHGHVTPETPAENNLYETRATFEVDALPALEIETTDGRLDRIAGGSLAACGAMRVDGVSETERVLIGNLTLQADSDGVLTVVHGFDHDETPKPIFDLPSIVLDLDRASGDLRIVGTLTIAEAWADERNLPEAAGAYVGTITLEVETTIEAEKGAAQNSCRSARLAGGSTATAPNPTPGPDVMIGELQSVIRYFREGDITAYAVGTNACNIGDQRLNWYWYDNRHPVIFEHLYRLDDRGFQQVGMSWLKHGFYAVSGDLCTECLDSTDGTQLGVGCSDPYTASLNGERRNMIARSRVNPHTGYFDYLGYDYDYSTAIERRLQVHDADIDPALNPDALYFIEGHYITADDASWGNDDNNASYRQVQIEKPAEGIFNIVITASLLTKPGQSAIRAWKDTEDPADPPIVETNIYDSDEGLFTLAAKTVDLGNGSWRYLYALQNLNSERAARSFTVPLPLSASVDLESISFHDVDYHSGDPYLGTDWTSEVAADGTSITWYTDSYGADENANALRYGTTYSFSFECDVQPASRIITLGIFKPGTPNEEHALSLGPKPDLSDCNGNGISDECDLSCAGCEQPCATSKNCNNDAFPDECEIQWCGGDPYCQDCNLNGVLDGCENGCENATAKSVDDAETVELNPGGGSGDPTEDVLVVFTNQSGTDGASVDANETIDEIHPNSGGFVAFSTALIVETTLDDGEFLMQIVVPFGLQDLGSASYTNIQVLWYDSEAATWRLAVAGNTQNSPGHDSRIGDRDVRTGAVTPALAELSNDLGDFGIFWNTSTLRGFSWANVDHTSGFAAGVQTMKNRYISMIIPPSVVAGVSRSTAVRVNLASLHHPESPLDPPDFGAWEGEYRWLNSLSEDHNCPDSPSFPGSVFRCAVLGCAPEYRNWTAELVGETIHVTGAAVVPSSRYDVALLDENCEGQEDTCTDLSGEVSIFTATFGDVDPDAEDLVVLDVARIVDHLKGVPLSLPKPAVHLRPNVPDSLTENAGVLDVATAVDAVKGNAYWHFGDFGPCTDACLGEALCP